MMPIDGAGMKMGGNILGIPLQPLVHSSPALSLL